MYIVQTTAKVGVLSTGI